MNLPKYFPTTFKKVNNQWYFGNQKSTYELCCDIRRILDKDDIWMNNLYDILKTDSFNKDLRYGTYAGSNKWSPTYTDKQLEEFISLVDKISTPS
tara:strand:- start:65 stop:349 length:285 start_codon:yes stop_codon:yes gene_type:complete